MSIDVASILAAAQVARIANDVVQQYLQGDLTREELDLAWASINAKAASARQAWEASKGHSS